MKRERQIKKNSPQALQTGFPSASRLHRGVAVVPQFMQGERPGASTLAFEVPFASSELAIVRDR